MSTGLEKYPQKVPISLKNSGTFYSRAPGYYAVHGTDPAENKPDMVTLLNEGAIAIHRGEPEGKVSGTITPAYSLTPGGSLSVPTGLIFIRFSDGIEVMDRKQEILKAGYSVAQSLPYAPNAAWLTSLSGNIDEALSNIGALEHIPGIDNVEPQMLMESKRR